MENDDFIKLITDYLETVLEESFKYRKSSKNLDDDEQNHVENLKRSGQRKYIANVSVCKGVPIYGFQLGYRFFTKYLCYRHFTNPDWQNSFRKTQFHYLE